MCRLYRSEIKMLHGAWGEAESEARRASDELKGFIPAAAGMALYQIGEIRMRRGDLPAAAEALQSAFAIGQDPEPALSLLRLAEGKVAAAQASIQQALDEPARIPSWRAPPDCDLYRIGLLPARVEIALAAEDLESARTASDELTGLANRFGTSSGLAAAATARSAVLLADGDPAARDGSCATGFDCGPRSRLRTRSRAPECWWQRQRLPAIPSGPRWKRRQPALHSRTSEPCRTSAGPRRCSRRSLGVAVRGQPQPLAAR